VVFVSVVGLFQISISGKAQVLKAADLAGSPGKQEEVTHYAQQASFFDFHPGALDRRG
jgi:hypothetical protein